MRFRALFIAGSLAATMAVAALAPQVVSASTATWTCGAMTQNRFETPFSQKFTQVIDSPLYSTNEIGTITGITGPEQTSVPVTYVSSTVEKGWVLVVATTAPIAVRFISGATSIRVEMHSRVATIGELEDTISEQLTPCTR